MLELKLVDGFLFAYERVNNDINGNAMYIISIFKNIYDCSGNDNFTNITNNQAYKKVNKDGKIKTQGGWQYIR